VQATQHPNTTSFSPSWVLLVLALPSLYFVTFFFLNTDFFLLECDRMGDYPILALEIDKAGTFSSLVGSYSRHGFNHPGPFSLYYYALAERLLFFIESYYGRYALAQLALTWIFVVGTQAIFFRYLGAPLAALSFAVMLLIFSAEGRTSFFADIWGPAALPTAMLAFLAASSALACAELKYFLLWALAFSVLASNHLGTWPVAGPIAAFVVISALLNLKRMRREGKYNLDIYARLSLLGGAFIFFIAAAPPVLESLTQPNFGNLGKIFHFALYRAQNKPFEAALKFLLSFYDLELGTFKVPGAFLLPAFVVFSLCVKLPRFGFAWNLRAVSLVSILLSLASALKIRGGLHSFILWHQYGAAVCLMVTAAYAATKLISRGQAQHQFGKLSLLLSVTIAVISALWSLQFKPPNSCRTVGAYHRAVTALKLDKSKLYILDDRKGRVGWPRYAILALALRRQGFHFCVLPRWEFMYGPTLTCHTLTRLPRWRGRISALRLYDTARSLIPKPPDAIDLGRCYLQELPKP